jgi:tetratricopeptide (TPR) repeat protein
LIDLLLSNPIVKWGLLVVGLLYAYNRLAVAFKLRVPNVSLQPQDLMAALVPGYAQAQSTRALQKMKNDGNYLGAGRVLEGQERLAEAAAVYQEGQEFFAAASVFEKMGKLEKAGELYLQSGDYKKAAQVFIQTGKHVRAADLFKEKGNNLEAARLYGLGGHWDKAASLYMKSGYPARAADAYEKCGEPVKAAEAYEQHFMENVSYATTYSSTASSPDQKSALLAGRLYEKAGDMKRALEIYQKGSYFKEAAGACGRAGQFARAAELYMRAEEPALAADAYDKAGDKVQAANLRGEVAFKAGRIAEAAGFFKEGRDYLRSAELYESIGMLAEAAGAYEAGDSHVSAANVYVRADMKEKAAAGFERGGDLETAARMYEEAGNTVKAIELFDRAGFTFKSGEAAAKAGDNERAIFLLQRVPDADENYAAATELLAEVFIRSNRPAIALERLQKTLAGQSISSATLGLFYWLAAAQEAAGRIAEALDLYKKIQAENLRFRDVEKRVARLQAGGGAAASGIAADHSVRAPQTPSAGIPAPAPASPPAAVTPSRVAPDVPAPAPAPTPVPVAPKGSRFVPEAELGRGPKGIVYRGSDTSDGHAIALRFLRADTLKVDGALGALAADLKNAAAIAHPNLVKLIGFVEIAGQRCVVSELVPGKSFAEPLAAGKRVPFAHALGLARVLSECLVLLHGRGIVHGGIHPGNLMATGGVVKLADLGLGRVFQGVTGARAYWPEGGRLDTATDLYAMAATLYHLVTGTNPRSAASFTPPSALTPGIPVAFDGLLLRALDRRQSQRFPSAAALLEALGNLGPNRPRPAEGTP